MQRLYVRGERAADGVKLQLPSGRSAGTLEI